MYDQQVLDQLYGNCRTYIHGHSVGGTNPSLLRAMGAGAPVLAFDCPFNREVTADQALLWSSSEGLTVLVDEVAESAGVLDTEHMQERLAELSEAGRARVAQDYRWEDVADEYERLLTSLVNPKVAT